MVTALLHEFSCSARELRMLAPVVSAIRAASMELSLPLNGSGLIMTATSGYFCNLFQHRIELFAVRTVVIRKVHQRQQVFSAYPRAGRVVKQRRMDQIFQSAFPDRRKRGGFSCAMLSVENSASSKTNHVFHWVIPFAFFFNVCNTACGQQKWAMPLLRQAGAIYLIKRHGDTATRFRKSVMASDWQRPNVPTAYATSSCCRRHRASSFAGRYLFTLQVIHQSAVTSTNTRLCCASAD